MKFYRRLVVVSVCLFFSGFAYSQSVNGDDIFKNTPPLKGDFIDVKIEPTDEDIQSTIQTALEKMKFQEESFNTTKSSIEKSFDELMNDSQTLMDKKLGTSKKTEESQLTETPSAKKKSYKKSDKHMVVTPSSKRELFISVAMSLRGTKYLLGGKKPSDGGLDCSGLVSFSAKQGAGINLSGNAQQIYDKTVHISLSDAVPGDLVFFKAASDSRISHVGIFLGRNTGDNSFGNQYIFINSASAGPRTGVVISGMNEPYWKRTFYGCGKFIQ